MRPLKNENPKKSCEIDELFKALANWEKLKSWPEKNKIEISHSLQQLGCCKSLKVANFFVNTRILWFLTCDTAMQQEAGQCFGSPTTPSPCRT